MTLPFRGQKTTLVLIRIAGNAVHFTSLLLLRYLPVLACMYNNPADCVFPCSGTRCCRMFPLRMSFQLKEKRLLTPLCNTSPPADINGHFLCNLTSPHYYHAAFFSILELTSRPCSSHFIGKGFKNKNQKYVSHIMRLLLWRPLPISWSKMEPRLQEQESSSARELQRCPSEMVGVMHTFHYTCMNFVVWQSMAGQADVCKGCPGRQLCLSQGI